MFHRAVFAFAFVACSGSDRGNYVGLNSSWDKGTAAYAREPNLTWLASFTDPPTFGP